MLSWFSALTITPVLIKWWLFKRDAAPPEADETDPYDKRIYRIYQAVLNALLRRKAPTLVVMAALLAAAIWGFGSVRQNFFPPPARRFSLSTSGSLTVPTLNGPRR